MVKAELDDLIDRAEVATIVGLTNPNAVSVYARRYADFPLPALSKGRCVLWLRSDVAAWARTRAEMR